MVFLSSLDGSFEAKCLQWVLVFRDIEGLKLNHSEGLSTIRNEPLFVLESRVSNQSLIGEKKNGYLETEAALMTRKQFEPEFF